MRNVDHHITGHLCLNKATLWVFMDGTALGLDDELEAEEAFDCLARISGFSIVNDSLLKWSFCT